MTYVRRPSGGGPVDGIEGILRTKADCQRTTNHEVVSVRYWKSGDVSHFSTWDRESYIDDFFCSGPCATRFAYIMAHADKCTTVYNEAIAERRRTNHA